ncbi:Uncharacterised protein [Acinetobacter baumannii]|nr:Uncharacterised protein [Acinetobacter baumannii]
MIERFIALHMMYDRIAPDEPTSEPATINMLFSRVKPIPAAAQPENELRSDTTTGISPPPTGAIHTQPNASASAVIAQKAVILPVVKK